MKREIVNTESALIVPVAMARPIIVTPPYKGEPPLYAWMDPWDGNISVVVEDFTVSPYATQSFAPCLQCMRPNQKIGEPEPACPHVRPVVLLRGKEIFVGTQLLGIRFLASGDWEDLPDRLWDFLERLSYEEMERLGRRDLWLGTPPVRLGGTEIA